MNSYVNPMLTDMYQLTMAYAYFKAGRHNEPATFELYFRKNPFNGEFTVFAGLSEILEFLESFHFTESDLAYVETLIPNCDKEFIDWLRMLDLSEIKVEAISEGTIVFPRLPLIQVTGSLAVGQLLETTLLNLVNFASLIATNAARFRLAAGHSKTLLEFGLRRAQGPDGGMTASKYAYMAGFNGTSNVLAGQKFGIPVKGTHAHAFVNSYTSLDQIPESEFKKLVLDFRNKHYPNTNESELAAFIAYASAFKDGFLALVDTYDTLASGVPNFICVAQALEKCGHKALGIRLDSGDLAYLSTESYLMFLENEKYFPTTFKKGIMIAASNDIDEEVLNALRNQEHMINVFGIGTNLVTCKAQPALGCVYKLVEINGEPRMKLSENIEKVGIPGSKDVFRLYTEDGPQIDLIIGFNEDVEIKPGLLFFCQHPFIEHKRCSVRPVRITRLNKCVWDGQAKEDSSVDLSERRQYVIDQLKKFRPDHFRPLNPTPYKVAVTKHLYKLLHELWAKEAPKKEIV